MPGLLGRAAAGGGRKTSTTHLEVLAGSGRVATRGAGRARKGREGAEHVCEVGAWMVTGGREGGSELWAGLMGCGQRGAGRAGGFGLGRSGLAPRACQRCWRPGTSHGRKAGQPGDTDEPAKDIHRETQSSMQSDTAASRISAGHHPRSISAINKPEGQTNAKPRH